MNRWTLVFAAILAFRLMASEPVEIGIPRQATVAEQIRIAQRMMAELVRVTAEDDRREKTLRAIVAWEAVAREWPEDRNATLLARLSQSDLWRQIQAIPNAVEVLESAQDLARELRREADVHGRLGKLYIRVGRPDDSELAFRKAERDPRLHVDARLAVMTLSDTAGFYSRVKKPREAAARLQRLSRMPHVTPSSRTRAALKAAEANLAAGEKSQARAAVNEAVQLLTLSRNSGDSPQIVASLERHLGLVRQQME